MSKTVLEMAKEAGLFTHKEVQPELQAFAELVRADERAKLADQPAQQEPVAWMQDSIELYVQDRPGASYTIPLYTSPQAQRKPLTEPEFEALHYKARGYVQTGLMDVVRLVEHHHDIKENT